MSVFVHAVASCCRSEEAAAALSPTSLAGVWSAAGKLELGAGWGPYGVACAAEDCFLQEVAMDHGRAAQVLRSCAVFLGGEVAGPAADLLARFLEVLAASTYAGFDGAGAGGRSCDGAATSERPDAVPPPPPPRTASSSRTTSGGRRFL